MATSKETAETQARGEPTKQAKVSDSYYNAHEIVEKGDPRVNGPYLSDINEAAEVVYRDNRMAEDAAIQDAKPHPEQLPVETEEDADESSSE